VTARSAIKLNQLQHHVAEKREKRAPLHSITSSARARKDSGIASARLDPVAHEAASLRKLAAPIQRREPRLNAVPPDVILMGLGKDAPLGRHLERSGTIVITPILSGLHHCYARI
jgi:hypothetical protein